MKKSNKKRADGRVQASIYLGRDENGKRKYKTVYGATQKEVDQKANEIRLQLARGVDLLQPDTLGEWAAAWLAHRQMTATANGFNDSRAKINRLLCYCPALDVFLDEPSGQTLSAVPIAKIKPLVIDRVIDRLAACNPHTGKPSGVKTICDYRHTFIMLFDFAILNSAVFVNPAKTQTAPKGRPREERRALTREEQERIRSFPHRARLPAMLMMLCGLRRGEVTALTWSDVDFEKKTISITRSYDFKANSVKPPKTAAGYRTVPLPDELIALLQQQPKRSILVCTRPNGEPLTATYWRRLLDSYLLDLNLEYGKFTKKPSKFDPHGVPLMIQPFTWHCLRHTYATILYDADVDVLTAKVWLGHSDIKTTLNIYTKLSAEREQLSAEKLNSFLSPDRNACQMHVSAADSP